MIDISTHKPLSVSTEGNAGPYIMVPLQQLPAVCSVLESSGFSHWVDEQAISVDGKPAITVINFRPPDIAP